jgi:hypothetical protein
MFCDCITIANDNPMAIPRFDGRTGDEGIDGRINQDPLGLDQILVQAKQYVVDRREESRHRATEQFVTCIGASRKASTCMDTCSPKPSNSTLNRHTPLNPKRRDR